ncbi:hypothetical protein D9758_014179 [Tetrapyrgos nigripes]|uniref:Uncharacterized protein n=1 Tax=Tetrapyrgos nigripes TaxID=182062 RepID=A0A8H5CMI8_9AGAR|nr:hypothetical protein D9758_014179 [Tetrapyrgos nigripes]
MMAMNKVAACVGVLFPHKALSHSTPLLSLLSPHRRTDTGIVMVHGLAIRQVSSAPEESGTPPFIIFDTLHALALFLLLVTYIAALISKSIVRMKTWFCLLLSCIIYCISFLVLVGHQGGPQPSFSLCIFQAGLIYAAPPTVAAAGLSFIIELYMRLSASLTASQVNPLKITVLMFLSPLVHLIIFWEALFVSQSSHHFIDLEIHRPVSMDYHISTWWAGLKAGCTVM